MNVPYSFSRKPISFFKVGMIITCAILVVVLIIQLLDVHFPATLFSFDPHLATAHSLIPAPQAIPVPVPPESIHPVLAQTQQAPVPAVVQPVPQPVETPSSQPQP